MSETTNEDAGRVAIVQPAGWPRPRGYANGAITQGPTLHVAGQIGWDERENMVSGELVEQFDQALANVLAVVAAAGGEPRDVARLTIYVTDLDAYRAGGKELGARWRARFGKHYPAMALVGVAGLVHPQAKVEIEAVAALPAAGAAVSGAAVSGADVSGAEVSGAERAR